ncbi:type I pullulanase [uncultured Bifidobacterium sp.]|uniref:type I pullulanase n=1 Tax=uncultured Bifidobacterium sp. TaxID=165187 RepID=UPI0028DD149A|nr:type I pullulanase [uncultured Bifidobacterium sp.]
MNPHPSTASPSTEGDQSHTGIWPVYDGELGAILGRDSTTFTVWAPTASAIILRLYRDSRPGLEPYRDTNLGRIGDGAWQTRFDERLDGVYYDYVVEFPDGIRTVTPDPWAHACGANGERSQVVDESVLAPEGWSDDVPPEIPREQTVIWETHVGDFSNDPRGGFPQAHRGRYLAFADDRTTLAGTTGGPDSSGFPTGVTYLRRLGVTHVQIMPFYDYGSVDETTRSPYNWGYDPVTYDVPEGSYASDPHDGRTRIAECRSMVASLHRNGMRVIMDVVYNHMFRSDNCFERMVPGYFCRRNPDGSLSNGSGCGNDMASERPMFSRFIVDSLVHWARDYHIDGFRFDLMGLIDVDTLNRARRALDGLPGGRSILMFGEPWAADVTAVDDSVALGDKLGLSGLDPRVGWFCDGTRDSVKGSVMDASAPGYVNGAAEEFADDVFHALDGWRNTESAPRQAGQLIQYVSAHDDLTLWDKLCLSMRGDHVLESDFDALGAIDDILNANVLATGIVLTSAGTPFMLSGEEFARTKFGCDNSFDSSARLNMLDWGRARRLASLTDWYRRLIAVRRREPGLYDAPRTRIAAPKGVVAACIGHDLVVVVNATHKSCHVAAPAAGDGSSVSWSRLVDSRRDGPATDAPKMESHADSLPAGGSGSRAEAVGPVAESTLPSPARSFILWKRD